MFPMGIPIIYGETINTTERNTGVTADIDVRTLANKYIKPA
jgi:hypothetical protein